MSGSHSRRPVAIRSVQLPELAVRSQQAPIDLGPPPIRSLPPLAAPSVRGWRSERLCCPVRSVDFQGPAVEPAAEQPVHSRPCALPPERTGKGGGHVAITPPADLLNWRDRLFFSLLPPVDLWLQHRKVRLPHKPFPYQHAGIAFLVPRRAALLADEMGLGKTMQAIVSIRLAMAIGLVRTVLLVCPKPLVPNWVREFGIWAPDLPVVVVEGSGARRRSIWQLRDAPVRIANYELLIRDIQYIEQAGTSFDLVVLDEAQRIKNPSSRTAQAVRRLRRQRSWALTGTPVENRPDDLVSIFEFLHPGLVKPGVAPAQLRAITEPYILRRVKEQVLDDIPEKIVRETHLDLSPAQRRSYVQAEKEGVLRLNRMGAALRIQNVFELVLRLKQICNFDPTTGESCKLEQLRQDLEEVAASNRKAIVFSQWVRTLQRLRDELAEFRPVEFHGGLSASQRQKNLVRFRDGNHTVLLISYGAGSVGLNLQFAQYAFLFDRWWNPAVEDQAINRVHRIGQKHRVIVTQYVVKGTVEERIAQILAEKRHLMAKVVPLSSDQPIGSQWTEEELLRLFDLPVPRADRRAA